jgi:hypothetical protein
VLIVRWPTEIWIVATRKACRWSLRSSADLVPMLKQAVQPYHELRGTRHPALKSATAF